MTIVRRYRSPCGEYETICESRFAPEGYICIDNRVEPDPNPPQLSSWHKRKILLVVMVIIFLLLLTGCAGLTPPSGVGMDLSSVKDVKDVNVSNTTNNSLEWWQWLLIGTFIPSIPEQLRAIVRIFKPI